MINLKTERKAIHSTALRFNEFGWILREINNPDFGIDALVETTTNDRPDGRILALQIKGGSSNFHKTKNYLTFYFDNQHKEYWISFNRNCPVLIILQDVDNKIYWEEINYKTIRKTQKQWKIDVPLKNILDQNSIEKLTKLIVDHPNLGILPEKYISLITEKENHELKVLFENASSDGLICEIYDKVDKYTFSLNYFPKKSEWDVAEKNFDSDSKYPILLSKLRAHLVSKLDSVNHYPKNQKTKYIQNTIDEIQKLAKVEFLEGIDTFLFDFENGEKGVPPLKEFIEAFIKQTKLKRRQFTVMPIDHSVIFRVKEKEYEMHTDNGRIAELKSYVDNESITEIQFMTNVSIWNEIYLEIGIEKIEFIPIIFKKWQKYWRDLYEEIKSKVGSTEHLDDMKDESWRQLNLFSEGYNDAGDLIYFAYNFDDLLIYPFAVLTMVNILNEENCLEEYVTYEFDNDEWETIVTNKDQVDEHYFYLNEMERLLI